MTESNRHAAPGDLRVTAKSCKISSTPAFADGEVLRECLVTCGAAVGDTVFALTATGAAGWLVELNCGTTVLRSY